jgi:nucleoside diphosphate kinase
MVERTLCIIKPDAVAAGHPAQVLSRLEKAGFRILALRMRDLCRAQAEAFSMRDHRSSARAFMSSGPHHWSSRRTRLPAWEIMATDREGRPGTIATSPPR